MAPSWQFPRSPPIRITEINLKTDATLISFADGSQITGQTTFVMGGVVKTAAAVTLVSEADGHKLETTVDGATTIYVAKDTAGHVMGVQTPERRRDLPARRRRLQSVHVRTLWKLTKSQVYVNFRSSNFREIVRSAIRAKERETMVREIKSHQSNSKTKGTSWLFPPSLRLLSVLRRVVMSTCFFWGAGAAHAEVSENVGVHGTCGPIEFSTAKGNGDWEVSVVFSGVEVSAIAPSDEEEGHVVPAFLSCETGNGGYYLMLQFTDPLKACAKCSVTDVYDERGKRLVGLWQKIYLSERMANVFQVSIGGMGQE